MASSRYLFRAHPYRARPLECKGTMIYCVIPPELADELFDRLVDYYKDNPNVKVMVDRRAGREPTAKASDPAERRRTRIPGTFPEIEAH